MKTKKILDVIELTLRIYVAFKLSVYGLGKIVGGQFHRRGKLPEEIANIPLADVGSFDLAWTFFGYSTAYIFFIGISQILGSILLIIPRTKLFGALILTPILVNIIIIDIAFKVSNGALFSASLYLIAIILIFWINKKRVQLIIKNIWMKKVPKKIKEIGINIVISIAIAILLFFIENLTLNFIGR